MVPRTPEKLRAGTTQHESGDIPVTSLHRGLSICHNMCLLYVSRNIRILFLLHLKKDDSDYARYRKSVNIFRYGNNQFSSHFLKPNCNNT